MFAGIRIDELCGRGGMGVVYRGRQVGLDRTVALKLIAPEWSDQPGFRRRFEHEARLAASIEHPHVVPVYEAGEHDRLLYLVMRYIAGTDMRALLAYEGQLAPAKAAGIVTQVAAALDAAHATGLVHRDVKPANVLLADDTRAYLTDFGMAKHVGIDTGLTASKSIVGTLDYAAPEVLEGGAADARADVYSLGCVLFEALTGAAPFRRESATATMLAHLRDPIPSVTDATGLSAEFDALLARALAKRPEARLDSAGDLARAAAALAALTDDTPTVTHHPAARRRPAWPARWAVAAVCAGVVAILAIAASGDRPQPRAGNPGLEHPVVLADPSGNRLPSAGKPTTQQMRDAVAAFQRAYADEDVAGLYHLLMPGFSILDHKANLEPINGVDAALDRFKQEFALRDNSSYRITRLELQTGLELRTGHPSGRARWRFELTLPGGDRDRGWVDALLERRGDVARFASFEIEDWS
jgi:serine/threonine-protein kinase